MLFPSRANGHPVIMGGPGPITWPPRSRKSRTVTFVHAPVILFVRQTYGLDNEMSMRRELSSEVGRWLKGKETVFAGAKQFGTIPMNWSQCSVFLSNRALTEPFKPIFLPFGLPVRRAAFPHLEGSCQPCRPTPLSPAAIAVKHLRSRAASRISMPAVASASRAAALIVAQPVRRSATPAERPTTAMARLRHTAAVNARSVRCSARPARAAARRLRCHSSPAATSPFTARLASSSAAAEIDLVATAGAATKWLVSSSVGGWHSACRAVPRLTPRARTRRSSAGRTDAQE